MRTNMNNNVISSEYEIDDNIRSLVEFLLCRGAVRYTLMCIIKHQNKSL